MWVSSAVRMMWQLANSERGPQSDFTEIVRLVEEWAVVEVKAETEAEESGDGIRSLRHPLRASLAPRRGEFPRRRPA